MEWIGGSFVSDSSSPKDIDVVVWVEGIKWDTLPNKLQGKYYDLVRGASARYGAHGYLLSEVPSGHADYEGYLKAREEWKSKFSSIWGSTRKRGFLEVAGQHLS